MNLGKDSITDKNRPCMNCPDRYPACSDHCKKPEFLAQKERNERLREAMRQARLENEAQGIYFPPEDPDKW